VPKCEDGTDTCTSNPIRSLDGTRAFYYVDPVPLSNDWVIFFPGGGACGKMEGENAAEACYTGVTDANGVGFDGYEHGTGDACEMTTSHASGSCRVTAQKSGMGQGILDPSSSNPFSGYNRVWMNKSTFDRFMGNMNNIQAYDGDDILLSFHGRRIIKAVLKDLARANGTITVGNERVPDLSLATSILFAGESGGAGGLLHNAQWLKHRVAEVSSSIKVNYLASSRLLPWLEAEVYFGSSGNGIWDDVYSGTSDLVEDDGQANGEVTIAYSNDTFQPDGAVRELLDSWGDIDDTSNLYLDDDCKTQHDHASTTRWKCYDEGHVALYHTHENFFFFESLKDGTHTGPGSPTFWVDTVDFGGGAMPAVPGFVWDPSGTFEYIKARRERMLYTMDSILLNTNHRGYRGFYAPDQSCHTCLTQNEFYARDLTKPTGLGPNINWEISYAEAVAGWHEALVSSFGCGLVCDMAVIDDRAATYSITYSNVPWGGGWSP
jgi:pectinacetylesterase